MDRSWRPARQSAAARAANGKKKVRRDRSALVSSRYRVKWLSGTCCLLTLVMICIPMTKRPEMRLLLMAMAGLLYGAAPALSAQIVVPHAGRAAAALQGAAVQGLQPLPSDAELEAAGALIGTIEIHLKQIFDLDEPRENNWLF